MSLSLSLVPGLAACAFLVLAGFANGAVGSAGQMVVVLPPWADGAAIVARAGGRIVGPSAAPMSVLATGASAEAFRRAGAWAVLDGQSLAEICGNEGRK